MRSVATFVVSFVSIVMRPLVARTGQLGVRDAGSVGGGERALGPGHGARYHRPGHGARHHRKRAHSAPEGGQGAGSHRGSLLQVHDLQQVTASVLNAVTGGTPAPATTRWSCQVAYLAHRP